MASPSQRVGKTILHYRIIEKIGRGRHGRRLQAEGVKLDMHLRQFKDWRVMRVLD